MLTRNQKDHQEKLQAQNGARWTGCNVDHRSRKQFTIAPVFASQFMYITNRIGMAGQLFPHMERHRLL